LIIYNPQLWDKDNIQRTKTIKKSEMKMWTTKLRKRGKQYDVGSIAINDR
jgi:hypothetical protein